MSTFQAGEATILFSGDDSQLGAASSRVQRSLRKLRDRMQGVSRAARRMLLIGGGAMAGFIKLASDQETAVAKLEATLRSNGDEVDVWSAKLQAAASSIQEITVHGDEAIMPVMALGRNLGISADQLDAATRAAIGLSEVTGQDLNQSMRNIALALQGNFQMLARYIPELRGVTDASDGLRIVQELTAKGFEQASERAKTTAGQMAQLKNQLGDAAEVLGAGFLPMVRDLVDWISRVTPQISAWVKENSDLIVTVVKWSAVTLGVLAILPRLITTVSAAVTAVKALSLAFGPWGVAAAAAAGSIALLVGWMARLNRETEDMVAKTREARRAGDSQRAADMQRLDTLRRLADQEGLSNEQKEEAAGLIQRLEGRWGELGVRMDDTAGRIIGVAEAQERLNEAMAQQKINELTSEMQALEQEAKRVQGEIDSLVDPSLGANPLSTFADMFTGGQLRASAVGDLGDELSELERKMFAIQRQRAALESGDRSAGALTGDDAPDQGGAAFDFDSAMRQAQEQRVAAEIEELRERLHKARLNQIEDEHAREMALLNFRFDRELEQAGDNAEKIALIEQTRAIEAHELRKRHAEEEAEQREAAMDALRRVQMFAATDAERAAMAIQDQAQQMRRELEEAFEQGEISRSEFAEAQRTLDAETQRRLQEAEHGGDRRRPQFAGTEQISRGIQLAIAGARDPQERIAKAADRQIREQQQGNRILQRVEGVLQRIADAGGGGFQGVFGGT